jgi:S1-C subfamily serine protease
MLPRKIAGAMLAVAVHLVGSVVTVRADDSARSDMLALDAGDIGLALAPHGADRGDGPAGVLVTGVARDSAAARSGLARGDIIVRIDDAAITTPDGASAEIARAASSGKAAVALLVIRGGRLYYLALVFGTGGA